MINERDIALCSIDGSRRKSFFVDCTFMQLQVQAVPDDLHRVVNRITKGIDIFTFNKVFIPTNVNNCHWLLIVIDIQLKCINVYDSMSMRTIKYTDVAKNWLGREAIKLDKKDFNVDEWIVNTNEGHVPQQGKNNTECGVFTIMCADFLSDNLPLTYTLQQMPFFRKKIAADIIRGSLTYKV